jgi:hypothetical protein
MTAAELLQPRFEVIADYPDNHFGAIGTILDRDWAKYPSDDENQKAIWRISDFPHLFQKLNWWEKRTEDQMPNRVKYKDVIYEVVDLDMKQLTAKIRHENSRHVIFLQDIKQDLFFPID